MGLSEFFWNLGAWNWFVVAVALFALESIVPGVHFVWFGIAAVIVGALGLTIDIAWEWQLIAFAIISCITVFFARRYASPEVAASDQPELNLRAEQYVGRVVMVEEAISDGRGKVRVGDTVWNAQGSDTPQGARVKITGTNGTCLLVEHAFY
jgi:membrane protein implicated in regulation of membrane protease activity